MNFTILDRYPDRETEERWREFLANAEMATHYTTPDFFNDPFIRGGERFAILVTGTNNRIEAVLTGVDDGRVIESGMAVRPQTAFRKGTNIDEAAKTLASALTKKSGEHGELVRFNSWAAIDKIEEFGFANQLATSSDRIIMLDLSEGADKIFKGFSQTRRNEIRKAIKHGELEIKELETAAELNELYAIHLDWNMRKGTEPDVRDDFEFAFAQKDHRKVIIAKFEGKVIASSYYRFCTGGVVEYAANNSLVEFQKLRPNDLIAWRSIEWACRSGFSHYSMGGSHLFLRRFGGYEVATHRYQLDRTFLRKYQKKEAVKNFLVKTYMSFPSEARQKLKQIAGKI